jgi:hypothetical protein
MEVELTLKVQVSFGNLILSVLVNHLAIKFSRFISVWGFETMSTEILV